MAMTLITTNSTSGTDDVSAFTSGLTSSYKHYIFKFYGVNPAVDDSTFQFDGSVNGGTDYGVDKTTTSWLAEHEEDDSPAQLGYRTGQDVADDSGVAQLCRGMGNGADESLAGILYLFNPAGTTFNKHFYGETSNYGGSDTADAFYFSGYFNTTSAINAVRFNVSTGDFDSVIKMYGVA